MFSCYHNVTLLFKYLAKNLFKSSKRNYKVVIAGAAGGIGQALALLLKQNFLVSHLALYDVAPITPGVAVDVSHMDTRVKVTGHRGPETLCTAMIGAHVVVIPAGVPRKPGMSRDDLFDTNANIVFELAAFIARTAPCAIMAFITNPINSVVPVASETCLKVGCYDPARIIGVTTLDVVRSAAFIGEINCIDPRMVHVPVIGGHAGKTIIPVLSQSVPPVNLCSQNDVEMLTKRIQEAGTEVVKAKAGGGSATLSMAYAAERMVNAILRGLSGEPNVVECAYVRSNITQVSYFANPVLFGRNGVEMNLGFGLLNHYEKKLFDDAIPILKKNIVQGEAFVKKRMIMYDLKE